MNQLKLKRSTFVAIFSFLLAILFISPAVFSQGNMNQDGNLHNPPIPTVDNDHFYTYYIPNQPGKFLYLEATGGDGGKREFTVASTCTKEGGQGAFVSAWFKIGTGGLQPGGQLRMIPGKKGTDAHGIGIEGGGGGGGTGIVYLPPGSDYDNPKHWKIVMVAGGGGGAASNGFCDGSSGMPGQVMYNGGQGNGASPGNGGTEGGGGKPGSSGASGGGWKYGGQGASCTLEQAGTEHDVDGIKHVIFAGGGYSGSGTIVTEEGVVHWSHWIGGHGGPNGNKGPGTSLAYCGGNFNAGGLGFGGGGSGVGSGGGGGGFSGGGGGGLVGPGGGGGGGGGGSYVNPAYGESFSVVMHQRGTTSNPADGSIKYKFASIDPIATRDLGFEAHKGTEVSVLKAGDWTLLWQYDGNLVLYGPGFPNGAWASNTAGTDLFFQGDGNLVIYQANADPWSSDTPNDHHNGKGGRKLVLTESGNLFIADQDNKVIWTGH